METKELPVTDDDLHQIDELYYRLRAAQSLLTQGKYNGLRVFISPRMAKIIEERHGESSVLCNTYQRDEG